MISLGSNINLIKNKIENLTKNSQIIDLINNQKNKIQNIFDVCQNGDINKCKDLIQNEIDANLTNEVLL